MADRRSTGREFAFLCRDVGEWRLYDSIKRRLMFLQGEVADAPHSDKYDPYRIEVRRLTPAEVMRWRAEFPPVEAEFLGPVFGGIALTLHHPDESRGWASSPELLEALAQTAWSCGGPVIRLADAEVRHGIDWVTFPADVLCEPLTFGEGILLRTDCDEYLRHVHESLQATFAEAGAKFDYSFYGGRKGRHLLVGLRDHYPIGERPRLWRVLLGVGVPPDRKERLQGQQFRVIAHPPALNDDRAFWFGG